MVERQLRRRGISDERVLRRDGRGAARALPARGRARATPTATAPSAIDEGQTMSQPWIVACMTALLELQRRRDRARGRHRLRVRAPRCSRAAPREVVTIERHRSLAERARRGARGARLRQRRGPRRRRHPGCARRARRSAGSRSPRRPRTGRRQALLAQLAPGGALVCPVRRGDRELLMRFRRRHGPRGADRPGPLRAARGRLRLGPDGSRATALAQSARLRGRVRPELLFARLRRPAQARPQDRHDPARRQVRASTRRARSC